jgi:signal transduction histidine kinase
MGKMNFNKSEPRAPEAKVLPIAPKIEEKIKLETRDTRARHYMRALRREVDAQIQSIQDVLEVFQAEQEFKNQYYMTSITNMFNDMPKKNEPKVQPESEVEELEEEVHQMENKMEDQIIDLKSQISSLNKQIQSMKSNVDFVLDKPDNVIQLVHEKPVMNKKILIIVALITFIANVAVTLALK